MPLFSAYCAAKGGLLLVTRALMSEWGQYGIKQLMVDGGYTAIGHLPTPTLAENKWKTLAGA